MKPIYCGDGIMAQINQNTTKTYKDFYNFLNSRSSKLGSTVCLNSRQANTYFTQALQGIFSNNYWSNTILDSKRIFNPDRQLIREWFKNKYTRRFIITCSNKSKQTPGLIKLTTKYTPDENDIEKLERFLYLFNVTLEKEEQNLIGWMDNEPVLSKTKYYIKVHDDPK